MRYHAVLLSLLVLSAGAAAAQSNAAAEYGHLNALAGLSVAVAQAMPAEKFVFRPHPESMNFGELLNHIAATNYQFCARLKDSGPPPLPSPAGMESVVKLLGDSFGSCSALVSTLTEEQKNK